MSSINWRTPADYILRARTTLQGIDLDPASDREANFRVQADRFIDEKENGLTAAWGTVESPVSVFLNPPMGKTDGKQNKRLFWERLVRELDEGKVSHALFVAYNIEDLVSLQRVRSPLAYPVCVPSKRVRHVKPDGTVGECPRWSSAFIYLPGTVDNTQAFVRAFKSVGSCVRPFPESK